MSEQNRNRSCPPSAEDMDVLAKLEDLEAVAAKLSIEIVNSDLSDREHTIQSGYCKLRGQDMIILDKELLPAEKVETILEALKRFDLEPVFVPAWIRKRLENDEVIEVDHET